MPGSGFRAGFSSPNFRIRGFVDPSPKTGSCCVQSCDSYTVLILRAGDTKNSDKTNSPELLSLMSLQEPSQASLPVSIPYQRIFSFRYARYCNLLSSTSGNSTYSNWLQLNSLLSHGKYVPGPSLIFEPYTDPKTPCQTP